MVGNAFAQGAAAKHAAAIPMVGNKALVQAKPQPPQGCKLVGTVKGTKLWAGDCVAKDELRGSSPADDDSQAPPPAEQNKTD
jgi:hypothetical protein